MLRTSVGFRFQLPMASGLVDQTTRRWRRAKQIRPCRRSRLKGIRHSNAKRDKDKIPSPIAPTLQIHILGRNMSIRHNRRGRMLTHLTQEVSRAIADIVFTRAQQGRDDGDNGEAFSLLDKSHVREHSLPAIAWILFHLAVELVPHTPIIAISDV